MIWHAVVLPFLVGMAVLHAQAQQLSPQEVFRQVSPSVVVVEATSRRKNSSYKLIVSGSGVTIEGNKYGNRIVTNCHVVDSDPDGDLRIVQGSKSGFGIVVGRDDARDICILAAVVFEKGEFGLDKGIELPKAQISSSNKLEVGDPVYAVGAPQGLELTLSDGLVSGIREYEGTDYIQTTAPISQGSSGGGLFDAQGRLVGITTMYLKDGQALNFAVPAELIAAVPKVGNGRKSGRAEPTGATESEAQAAVDAAVDAAAAAGAPTARPAPSERNIPKDRWQTIYEGDRYTVSVDTHTVTRDGRNVTVWVRNEYTKPKQLEAGKSYVEKVTRMTYYCGARQSSYDQGLMRNSAGEIVLSIQLKSYEIERLDVMPETAGEAQYEAVCSL